MATETARAIEAILMVADQPVPPQLLAQLLEMKVDEVTGVLDELMASYEVEDRGFILTKVAGGYRYQSHPDLAPYVERFVLEGQTARLSAAALETLAIIAYKQPISRAQVAQVRGVNVDGVVKTLEQRGYIAEIGRDPGPGNPSLFGTTDAFLEKLGLASLADLPPIAGFVPGPDVVEQLEQGLRAEIDAETAAYVADLAARADDAAAEEAGEEAGAETAETIEVVDVVEVDADGDVVETVQVTDDTVVVTDDGHVVEVVDVVTETVEVTPAGDVIDVVDETVVVVEDGEVVEATETIDEIVVVADAPVEADEADDPAGDDDKVEPGEEAVAHGSPDQAVDEVAPGATERDPDVPPT